MEKTPGQLVVRACVRLGIKEEVTGLPTCMRAHVGGGVYESDVLFGGEGDGDRVSECGVRINGGKWFGEMYSILNFGAGVKGLGIGTFGPSTHIRNYEFLVPTGSTQFLLVVRISLPGLLEKFLKKVLQNNQLVFEEKIRVLSSELENTTNLLKYSEKVNAEMSLEKQDLQAKLENERAINAKWTSSSKNLVKLIDSSMTVRTKIGLGFDEYIGENELGWDDSEFSVFTPTPEDVEGKPLYNRFVKTDRMKAVPPPLSGNYIPLSDPTDLDESQMTYGPKQTHTSDSEPKTSDIASTSEYASCKSNLSAESPEFFPKSVCARNESVRKADNPRKNNKSPRGNKRSWNGMMTQKLGENFEFNNKACYVCGRFSHLHYTCKNKRKVNDQKQVTPVWNNSRRVNHQNSGRLSHLSPKSNMIPQALLTKSGLVYVNSLKRLFHKKIPNYNRYFNKSVNSVKDTRVYTARPKTEVNTVKASASWVWKPKQEVIDHVSKSNNSSKTLSRYDYVDAYGRYKTVLAWDFKRRIKQIRDQDHDSILKLTTADLLRNLKLTKSNSSLWEDY
ncbi:hypothetical protein Tco_0867462 [Tanacetum coccineum]